MKLLLDEKLPRQLKKDFEDHEVYTVGEMGWNGKENGELLGLIIKHKFEVLLTGDKISSTSKILIGIQFLSY